MFILRINVLSDMQRKNSLRIHIFEGNTKRWNKIMRLLLKGRCWFLRCWIVDFALREWIETLLIAQWGFNIARSDLYFISKIQINTNLLAIYIPHTYALQVVFFSILLINIFKWNQSESYLADRTPSLRIDPSWGKKVSNSVGDFSLTLVCVKSEIITWCIDCNDMKWHQWMDCAR